MELIPNLSARVLNKNMWSNLQLFVPQYCELGRVPVPWRAKERVPVSVVSLNKPQEQLKH